MKKEYKGIIQAKIEPDLQKMFVSNCKSQGRSQVWVLKTLVERYTKGEIEIN